MKQSNSFMLIGPLSLSLPRSPESFNQKAAAAAAAQPESADFDHVPNKRRKQFLSVLVALGAMLSYALLTGMVSIQHVQQEALEEPPDLQEDLGEDGEGEGRDG